MLISRYMCVLFYVVLSQELVIAVGLAVKNGGSGHPPIIHEHTIPQSYVEGIVMLTMKSNLSHKSLNHYRTPLQEEENS